MTVRTILSAAALSVGFASFSMAQVSGTVKLEGDAPEMKEIDMSGVKECAALHADPVSEETVVSGENGELANVVVWVKKEEGMELPDDVPAKPAVLDQEGCQYKPHVLAAMVGQEFVIKNSDGFLHNVHSLAETNPSFNFGQPNKDPGKKVDPMKAAEQYKVKCDVHPWMLAHVHVFDHPFFAVSSDEGKYEIANLPDGSYTFVAWHEQYGEQEQQAEVKDGKAELNFTFKAAEARANPTDGIEVKLASATSGDEKKQDCGSCCDASKAKAVVAKAASE